MKTIINILLITLITLFGLLGCTSKQPSPTLCASVCDGLVAYYPFYGDATDKSGNGLDGKVLGATLTKDRTGYPNHAYRFDGKDDYIEIGEPHGLNEGTVTLNGSMGDVTDVMISTADALSDIHAGLPIGINQSSVPPTIATPPRPAISLPAPAAAADVPGPVRRHASSSRQAFGSPRRQRRYPAVQFAAYHPKAPTTDAHHRLPRSYVPQTGQCLSPLVPH